MRRAAVFVFLAVAALGGCRTCIDGTTPRNYACSGDAGAGVNECPDEYFDDGGVKVAWACNTTWGYCFDTTKGEPNPCSADEQCGGGWRCTPDGRCGDPSQEGDVSILGVDAGDKLHPLAFEEAPDRLEAAAPQRTARPLGAVIEGSLAGRSAGPGVEVLSVSASTSPDGTTYETRYARLPSPGDDFAVTVGTDTRPRTFVWSLPNKHVVATELLPGGGTDTNILLAPTLTGCSWVAPVRTAGEPSPVLNGAVQVRHDDGLAVVSPFPGRPTVGVGGDAGELAVLTSPYCDSGWLVVVTRPDRIEVLRVAGDGGVAPLLEPSFANPGDLRVAARDDRAWVSWRYGPSANAAHLAFAEVSGVCTDAGIALMHTELQRSVCPRGDYRAYDLAFTGPGAPELITECVEYTDAGEEQNDIVYVGEQKTPFAYLPPRIVTRESAQVFSRFAGGQLTQGSSLLEQEPVSLPLPPQTLYPTADGGLHAPSVKASFGLQGWGFMIEEVSAWTALPANYVESEDWYIARSGVVIDLEDDQAIALPEDDWANPSAYVLSSLLAPDGGPRVLVATHDDAFDVAEMDDPQPVLVTRLRPSPATPILSLALQPARDGGTAEGYLVAGLDLFEVRAPTPRRWSASKVALSGLRPVFVWFDHERPRALLDDGTVMGLSTRVPLSVTLEDEVRAGGQLCGAPFALTASALYRLVPSATGDGGARYEWLEVGLDGADEETDFSRGRLLTLDDQLYVFSNAGETWVVSPPENRCPSE